MQTAALHAMHVSQITLHQTWSKTYWDMSISWDFFPRKLHGPVYTKSCLNGISCRHGYLLHPHGRAKDTSRHFFFKCVKSHPLGRLPKATGNSGSIWINMDQYSHHLVLCLARTDLCSLWMASHSTAVNATIRWTNQILPKFLKSLACYG